MYDFTADEMRFSLILIYKKRATTLEGKHYYYIYLETLKSLKQQKMSPFDPRNRWMRTKL